MRARFAYHGMQRLGWLLLVVTFILGGLSANALGANGWELVSTSNTTVRAGDDADVLIDLMNRTEAPSDGTPYAITVTLASGVTGISGADKNPFQGVGFDCGAGVLGASVITCSTSTVALSDVVAELLIRVSVDVSARERDIKTQRMAVSGGGLASASTADPITISATPPAFGIDGFDGRVTDAAGNAYTQAGGHPFDLSTDIDFNTATDDSPSPTTLQPTVGPIQPIEPIKDVIVDLPPGLVGNPSGLAQCTSGQLSNTEVTTARPLCPPTSQVGTATIVQNGGFLGNVAGPVPVFNLVPPPDRPALFGMNIAGSVIVLDTSVRTGSDYGITVTARNASEGVIVDGTHIDFWGIPFDASHDHERSCPGETGAGSGGPTCGVGNGQDAFFRQPTACTPSGVGLKTTVHADSWTQPGKFVEASFMSHLGVGYPFNPLDPTTPWGAEAGPDNCANVPFDARLDARPVAGTKAASPMALAVDLTIPQDDIGNRNAISQSDLKKAEVTLPEGVHVNASSADGLGACSSAQIALRSDDLPTCPEASKIGAVTIETPLLDQEIAGSVYLAKPFDNPFNSLVAVYLVASARGVVIKLPGEVRMDPTTGRITSTFDNNPQLPVSSVHLEFKSGPRAPLSLPNRCGTYTTHAVLTGWSGAVVSSDSSYTLTENAKGQPCPPKFTPGFSAGTKSNSAGSPSSFLLRLTRDDDDEILSGLTVHMPSGLTGKPASADLCSDADAIAHSCPAGSKIGDVTVGSGAGTNPFFITNGKAYFTGPYKGAPFGVAIDVPAVAGPFDLGTVLVRSALFVDKQNATIRIVSDPFPTILQGIPLDVRDVRVDVNKPDFFLNPTSCAKKKIDATIESTAGTKANVSDSYQASECASLGFKPRMVMRVGGRGHTRAGQTSPFTTTLTMPRSDQTNLRFVRVTLPETINARLNTIQDACTRAEFESDISKCAHAKAGTAVASTPLLRDPLKGTVYFVKNGNPIPDLFVALRGEVAFDLVGKISIVNNKLLRTTFATAPDVPVRSFTLRLLGGPSTASIGAVRNLCSKSSRRHKAQVDYIGQNGKVRQVDQVLQVAGCKKPRR